ncbi:hypothetical protein B9Z40_13390 [Limnohabitans sp. 15K]|nr:hypothetical protein B9Z40_13390 [Limnohabitans sp. 15K]
MQGELQGFCVDRPLFFFSAMVLDHTYAFFNKHVSKRVKIDLAPSFALTGAMIIGLFDLRGFDC